MTITKFCVVLLAVCALAEGVPSFRALNGVPAELSQGFSTSGMAITGALEQTVRFNDLVFRDMKGNDVLATMPRGRGFFAEGMPQVPLRTETVSLPRGKRAIVHLENLQIEETTAPVSLPSTPKSHAWQEHSLEFSTRDYGRYFPGKWHSVSQVEDVAYVSLFPVQWDRETGRALVLRSASIRVELVDQPVERTLRTGNSTPALILTSEALRPAAEKLKSFHETVLKVRSTIVTVETIDKNESPVALASYPAGIKSTDLSSVVPSYDPETKKGYHFELARKIKTYLEKNMAQGSNTKYVTILGDVFDVPPSYYFVTGTGFSRRAGVTDQCYAAKKECLEPWLAVGRLPFSSVGDLDNYLSKVNRWLKFAPTAASELALYGGKAFQSDVYIGELGTLKTLNTEQVDWRGVKKFHRTRKTFTKDNVLKMSRGETPSSFLYYLDHGNGNRWHVEDDYVSSREIMEAKDAGSIVNPVVVSIACINAAFDEELAKDDVLASAADGPESVGASLLKSRAGAVVYLGSARPALGMPVYTWDKHGNLSLTGTTYGLQMFDTFFDKYRLERGGKLGDIVLKMYRAYLNENGNDMETESNLWTYYNVALLGDPVLPLPGRTAGEKVYPFAKSTADFGDLVGDMPGFTVAEDKTREISFSAISPVRATLLKMPTGFFGGTEKVVQEESLAGGGKFVAKFPADDTAGTYYLRLENAVGVPLEKQVWFTVDGT